LEPLVVRLLYTSPQSTRSFEKSPLYICCLHATTRHTLQVVNVASVSGRQYVCHVTECCCPLDSRLSGANPGCHHGDDPRALQTLQVLSLRKVTCPKPPTDCGAAITSASH
jgi:hypothetical protein